MRRRKSNIMNNTIVNNRALEHNPFTNMKEFLSFILSLKEKEGIATLKLYLQDFNGGYSNVWEAMNFMLVTIDGYTLFYQEKSENNNSNITLLSQRGEMIETNIQNEYYSLNEEDYSKLEEFIKELAKELLGIENVQ